MLVQKGRAVVAYNLGFCVVLLERRADRFGERPLMIRHNLQGEFAASPQKCVVHQYDKARPCEKVGVGATAIIGLPEPLERRRATVRTVSDLLLAEEFEVTVIVEGDDAWQSPAAMGGFEEDGLRPWAEPDGPRNLFTTDAFRRPRAATSDIKRLLVADGEGRLSFAFCRVSSPGTGARPIAAELPSPPQPSR